jgi:hypothetical protein
MVFQDYSWPDKHNPSGNLPLSHNRFTFSTYAPRAKTRLGASFAKRGTCHDPTRSSDVA